MDDEATKKQLVAQLEDLRRSNKLLAELTEYTIELMKYPPTDLDGGLEIIVFLACRLLNTPHGFICRVSDELEFKAGLGSFSQDSKDIKLLAQSILENDKSLLIEHYDSWAKLSFHNILQTAIVVPIRSYGHTIGVIGLAHDIESGQAFNNYELEILEKFTNAASETIHRTIQSENIQQKFAAEVAFNLISSRVFSSAVLKLDVLSMLDILCQELVQVLDANNCRIALLDRAGITLTVVAEHNSNSEENTTIGQTILLADTPLFREAVEKKIVPRWQETSPLVVNLLSVNKMVSGITILNKADEKQMFSPDEIKFAVIIIEQMSRRVDKVQYYQQLNR
ncbi:MAG: GAF domain-containing protein [Deltaproteobacteria bacterium]|nr:GAF domain-containing protein [Deltaproteobacteria bacterium]